MSTRAYLTRDEMQEFARTLGEVIQKYTTLEKRPDTTEHHAIFALYRANMRPSDAS